MKQNVYFTTKGEAPKLGVVTAFEDIYDLAVDVAHDFAIPAQIILTAVDKEVSTAHALLGEGLEVLIGRGQLVACIGQESSVSVITVAVSACDILRSLLPFQHSHERLGCICFAGFAPSIEGIAQLLGIDMYSLEVTSLEDTPRVLSRAYELGITHIVGSYGLVRKAMEEGFAGTILRSGREAMVHAFEEAQHILTLRTHWREQAELVKGIFNATQDSILAINECGIITFMNANAQRLFPQFPAGATGKNINAIMPGVNFDAVLQQESGTEARQMTVPVGKRVVMLRYAPLQLRGLTVGAVICLQDVTELQRLEQLSRQKLHSTRMIATALLTDILGENSALQEVKRQAQKYARVDSSVLITGETGTGKELFAQGIHNASLRAKGPFVAINCAAVPEQLLESELFGYEDGAFTGARRGGKAGLFELAHAGSIFLDEVGEMSLPLQARMLRILQERMVMRLGGNRLLPINVRIIAATNRDIVDYIQRGLFREDVFYRLNTLLLEIPPLRERPEDIVSLAQYFLRNYSILNPKVQHITREACVLLTRHLWPGNVRELEHVIERSVVLCETSTITEADLRLHGKKSMIIPKTPAPVQGSAGTTQPALTVRTAERDLIQKVLERHHFHKGNAAQELGISRATLWRKMKVFSVFLNK